MSFAGSYPIGVALLIVGLILLLLDVGGAIAIAVIIIGAVLLLVALLTSRSRALP
jgi:hypothetical protein